MKEWDPKGSQGVPRDPMSIFLQVVLNKTPRGIKRSAVPLPCFFDVVKSQRVAGQRPRQGTKFCRMGRNSVRTYVRTSALPPPSGWPSDPAGLPPDPSSWPSDPAGWPSDPEGQVEGSEGLLEGSEGLLEGFEGLLEGSEGWLEGSEGQPAGSEGQPAGSEGQPEGGRTDVRTDGRTEFLPILQDLVPCWGRCPKSRNA